MAVLKLSASTRVEVASEWTERDMENRHADYFSVSSHPSLRPRKYSKELLAMRYQLSSNAEASRGNPFVAICEK